MKHQGTVLIFTQNKMEIRISLEVVKETIKK